MIHPIQAFKEMPAKKKVATAVGVVAAAGAVAAGTTAFIKGGKVINRDDFIKTNKKGVDVSKKFTTRMVEGFKKIGNELSEKLSVFGNRSKDVVGNVAEDAANAAENVAEKA